MRATVVTALLAAATPLAADAEGHGPAFGLATPTLARGQWSSDTAVMRLENEADAAMQFRQLLGYGLTEDLQLSLAFPLGQSGDANLPVSRGGSMMGAAETVEASILWRFHRTAPGIGMRRESALFLGVSEPTDETLAGIEAGTGFNLSAVTGYASRTTYWWLGGGIQGNAARDGAKALMSFVQSYSHWRSPRLA